MAQIIKVGMADLKVSQSPDVIISIGLGSCVGIGIYDPVSKCGGLAHIMLPDSTQGRNTDNLAKFADTAIPLMVKEILKKGAVKNRMVSKIAGGAQMFNISNAGDFMRIGERNVEAVKKALKEAEIKIVAEDTGGNYGRSLELDLSTGKMKVRTTTLGEKEL